jgi:hypothetical protein
MPEQCVTVAKSNFHPSHSLFRNDMNADDNGPEMGSKSRQGIRICHFFGIIINSSKLKAT